MSYLDHTNLRQFVSNFKNYIISMINGKANAVHTHSASEITSGTFDASKIPNLDASKITTGVIDIDRLPQGALERLVTVANQTARFALTSTDVQLGDTVKQTDTGMMYIVTDTTNLANDSGYTEYTAGSATSVPWSGVTGKPTFANVATSGSYNDLSDKPTIPTVPTNYVTTDTTQTVSGQKTWTAINTFSGGQLKLKSSGQEIGVTPSTGVIQYLEFADKNNAQHGKVGLWDYDNGASEIQMSVSDKYKDGVKDSTGTSDTAFLSFGFQYNGAKFLTFSGQVNNSVIPLATNSYSLGSSPYQWASVYAQTYYYKGTQWGLDTSNEWTGHNKFVSPNTNLGFKSTTAEAGSSTPSSNWIYWQDKNDFQDAYISRDIWSNGSDSLRIAITSKRANGAPSTTGTEVDCGFKLNIYTNGNTSIEPFDNGGTDLGSSTNQWKSVYADTYYYNGTAWGLDKYNQWSEVNDFNNLIGLNDGAELWFKNSKIDDFTTNPAEFSAKSILQLWNKNTTQYSGGLIDYQMTDGSHVLEIVCFGYPLNSTAAHQHRFRFAAYRDGGADFYPIYNGGVNLGTSTNKWKSLNGINPGALGMPNNSAYIDISSSISDRAYGANSFVAVTTGWIAIGSFASAIQIADDTTGMATTGIPGSDGFASVFLPVRANDNIRVLINQTSTTFQSFRLFPCLGNV